MTRKLRTRIEYPALINEIKIDQQYYEAIAKRIDTKIKDLEDYMLPILETRLEERFPGKGCRVYLSCLAGSLTTNGNPVFIFVQDYLEQDVPDEFPTKEELERFCEELTEEFGVKITLQDWKRWNQ